ncbi:hypothetical protein PCANC_13365 [Puccinia coronata f. sp. avenae]|uniref:Uncharacterized protein n=1 Tax=Puccinia coronata f. sp. avenae TaxID=200324 RepID=A0A2N5VTN8_9BASI|nr:hypothetical protein PCASD_02529 [Puccinia coronata f. sp. avenae]PLW53359.1 hypothetical protein PCANC_13365 [Puccinia coronata f. sp. avenae]
MPKQRVTEMPQNRGMRMQKKKNDICDSLSEAVRTPCHVGEIDFYRQSSPLARHQSPAHPAFTRGDTTMGHFRRWEDPKLGPLQYEN